MLAPASAASAAVDAPRTPASAAVDVPRTPTSAAVGAPRRPTSLAVGAPRRPTSLAVDAPRTPARQANPGPRQLAPASDSRFAPLVETSYDDLAHSDRLAGFASGKQQATRGVSQRRRVGFRGRLANAVTPPNIRKAKKILQLRDQLDGATRDYLGAIRQQGVGTGDMKVGPTKALESIMKALTGAEQPGTGEFKGSVERCLKSMTASEVQALVDLTRGTKDKFGRLVYQAANERAMEQLLRSAIDLKDAEARKAYSLALAMASEALGGRAGADHCRALVLGALLSIDASSPGRLNAFISHLPAEELAKMVLNNLDSATVEDEKRLLAAAQAQLGLLQEESVKRFKAVSAQLDVPGKNAAEVAIDAANTYRAYHACVEVLGQPPQDEMEPLRKRLAERLSAADVLPAPATLGDSDLTITANALGLLGVTASARAPIYAAVRARLDDATRTTHVKKALDILGSADADTERLDWVEALDALRRAAEVSTPEQLKLEMTRAMEAMKPDVVKFRVAQRLSRSEYRRRCAALRDESIVGKKSAAGPAIEDVAVALDGLYEIFGVLPIRFAPTPLSAKERYSAKGAVRSVFGVEAGTDGTVHVVRGQADEAVRQAMGQQAVNVGGSEALLKQLTDDKAGPNLVMAVARQAMSSFVRLPDGRACRLEGKPTVRTTTSRLGDGRRHVVCEYEISSATHAVLIDADGKEGARIKLNAETSQLHLRWEVEASANGEITTTAAQYRYDAHLPVAAKVAGTGWLARAAQEQEENPRSLARYDVAADLRVLAARPFVSAASARVIVDAFPGLYGGLLDSFSHMLLTPAATDEELIEQFKSDARSVLMELELQQLYTLEFHLKSAEVEPPDQPNPLSERYRLAALELVKSRLASDGTPAERDKYRRRVVAAAVDALLHETEPKIGKKDINNPELVARARAKSERQDLKNREVVFRALVRMQAQGLIGRKDFEDIFAAVPSRILKSFLLKLGDPSVARRPEWQQGLTRIGLVERGIIHELLDSRFDMAAHHALRTPPEEPLVWADRIIELSIQYKWRDGGVQPLPELPAVLKEALEKDLRKLDTSKLSVETLHRLSDAFNTLGINRDSIDEAIGQLSNRKAAADQREGDLPALAVNAHARSLQAKDFLIKEVEEARRLHELEGRRQDLRQLYAQMMDQANSQASRAGLQQEGSAHGLVIYAMAHALQVGTGGVTKPIVEDLEYFFKNLRESDRNAFANYQLPRTADLSENELQSAMSVIDAARAAANMAPLPRSPKSTISSSASNTELAKQLELAIQSGANAADPTAAVRANEAYQSALKEAQEWGVQSRPARCGVVIEALAQAMPEKVIAGRSVKDAAVLRGLFDVLDEEELVQIARYEWRSSPQPKNADAVIRQAQEAMVRRAVPGHEQYMLLPPLSPQSPEFSEIRLTRAAKDKRVIAAIDVMANWVAGGQAPSQEWEVVRSNYQAILKAAAAALGEPNSPGEQRAVVIKATSRLSAEQQLGFLLALRVADKNEAALLQNDSAAMLKKGTTAALDGAGSVSPSRRMDPQSNPLNTARIFGRANAGARFIEAAAALGNESLPIEGFWGLVVSAANAYKESNDLAMSATAGFLGVTGDFQSFVDQIDATPTALLLTFAMRLKDPALWQKLATLTVEEQLEIHEALRVLGQSKTLALVQEATKESIVAGVAASTEVVDAVQGLLTAAYNPGEGHERLKAAHKSALNAARRALRSSEQPTTALDVLGRAISKLNPQEQYALVRALTDWDAEEGRKLGAYLPMVLHRLAVEAITNLQQGKFATTAPNVTDFEFQPLRDEFWKSVVSAANKIADLSREPALSAPGADPAFKDQVAKAKSDFERHLLTQLRSNPRLYRDLPLKTLLVIHEAIEAVGLAEVADFFAEGITESLVNTAANSPEVKGAVAQFLAVSVSDPGPDGANLRDAYVKALKAIEAVLLTTGYPGQKNKVLPVLMKAIGSESHQLQALANARAKWGVDALSATTKRSPLPSDPSATARASSDVASSPKSESVRRRLSREFASSEDRDPSARERKGNEPDGSPVDEMPLSQRALLSPAHQLDRDDELPSDDELPPGDDGSSSDDEPPELVDMPPRTELASANARQPQPAKKGSLQELLDRPPLDPERVRFGDFLNGNHASENLEFYDRVQAFKKLPPGQRRAMAQAIVDRFIKAKSPSQVNVGAQDRAKIIADLPSMPDEDLGALFDAAVVVVTKLMESEQWRRFPNRPVEPEPRQPSRSALDKPGFQYTPWGLRVPDALPQSGGAAVDAVARGILSTPFRYLGDKIQDGHDSGPRYWAGVPLKAVGNVTGAVAGFAGGAVTVGETVVSNVVWGTGRVVAAAGLTVASAGASAVGVFSPRARTYGSTLRTSAKNLVLGSSLLSRGKQTELPPELDDEILDLAQVARYTQTTTQDVLTQGLPEGFKAAAAWDVPEEILSRENDIPGTGQLAKLRYVKDDQGRMHLTSDRWSGLKIGVYKKTGPDGQDTYYLSFVGTQMSRPETLKSDVAPAFGITDSAYQEASAVVKAFENRYGGHVHLIGHSLGGGLATSAGIENNVPVTGFNSVGVGLHRRARLGVGRINRAVEGGRVRQINTEGDVLSQTRFGIGVGAQLGVRYVLPGSGGHNLKHHTEFLRKRISETRGPQNKKLIDEVLEEFRLNAGLPHIEKDFIDKCVRLRCEAVSDHDKKALTHSAIREAITEVSQLVASLPPNRETRNAVLGRAANAKIAAVMQSIVSAEAQKWRNGEQIDSMLQERFESGDRPTAGEVEFITRYVKLQLEAMPELPGEDQIGRELSTAESICAGLSGNIGITERESVLRNAAKMPTAAGMKSVVETGIRKSRNRQQIDSVLQKKLGSANRTANESAFITRYVRLQLEASSELPREDQIFKELSDAEAICAKLLGVTDMTAQERERVLEKAAMQGSAEKMQVAVHEEAISVMVDALLDRRNPDSVLSAAKRDYPEIADDVIKEISSRMNLFFLQNIEQWPKILECAPDTSSVRAAVKKRLQVCVRKALDEHRQALEKIKDPNVVREDAQRDYLMAVASTRRMDLARVQHYVLISDSFGKVMSAASEKPISAQNLVGALHDMQRSSDLGLTVMSSYSHDFWPDEILSDALLKDVMREEMVRLALATWSREKAQDLYKQLVGAEMRQFFSAVGAFSSANPKDQGIGMAADKARLGLRFLIEAVGAQAGVDPETIQADASALTKHGPQPVEKVLLENMTEAFSAWVKELNVLYS
jgi:hypothetical protein